MYLIYNSNVSTKENLRSWYSRSAGNCLIGIFQRHSKSDPLVWKTSWNRTASRWGSWVARNFQRLLRQRVCRKVFEKRECLNVTRSKISPNAKCGGVIQLPLDLPIFFRSLGPREFNYLKSFWVRIWMLEFLIFLWHPNRIISPIRHSRPKCHSLHDVSLKQFRAASVIAVHYNNIEIIQIW